MFARKVYAVLGIAHIINPYPANVENMVSS